MPDEQQQMKRNKVGAIVLAAGRSARMGEPKQLLRLNEQTLLSLVLKSVRDSAACTIVLVLGHAAERIQRETPAEVLDGVTIALNKNYAEGMSSSVRAGLAALGPEVDAALILPADQPFVKPATLDKMIRTYRESQAEIVIPHFKGERGNPVLVDRSVFAEARKLKGDTGFRAIFEGHAGGILVLDVEDEGVVSDIDDREDYERLRNRGKRAL